MKPYYEENGITIYHADCRDVLPALSAVDLVLTDPPYIGLKGGTKLKGGGVCKITKESTTVGTPWGEDLSPLSDAYALARLGMIVFCSFHSVDLIPGIVGDKGIALISWFQRNAAPPVNNVPWYQTEFAWVFKKEGGLNWRVLRTMYDIPRLAAGCMATERFVDGNVASHPAQKPLDLISRIMQVGGESVLDPYCGTGTTLEAAKKHNRRAVGIEIEERYCEIAAKRLSQSVLDFTEVSA